MGEAETYYQEAIRRKAQKQEIQYAFKSVESGEETEEEKEKSKTSSYEEMIKEVTAYTARWSGQSPNTQQDMDKRYA